MHCLVVDPNFAFATLLSEELVRLGYGVTTCATGVEAVAAARALAPGTALALLDMAVEAPDALTLGHELRAILPGVRLVLIPLIGQEPALNNGAPSIQGLLPKPFFLPDLPAHIEAALQAPMPVAAAPMPSPIPVFDPETPPPAAGEAGTATDGAAGEAGVDMAWLDVFAPAAAPSVPEPDAGAGSAALPPVARSISRRVLRANQEAIVALMDELVRELGADTVLLTGDAGVLAWVGRLREAEVVSISGAVLQSRRASEQVARILGREQLRFEQSLAGDGYLLYALEICDAVLAVAVSGSASLGLLRHRTRSAGERIADLCSVAS